MRIKITKTITFRSCSRKKIPLQFKVIYSLNLLDKDNFRVSIFYDFILPNLHCGKAGRLLLLGSILKCRSNFISLLKDFKIQVSLVIRIGFTFTKYPANNKIVNSEGSLHIHFAMLFRLI